MTINELDKKLTEHLQALDQKIDDEKKYGSANVSSNDLCKTLLVIKNTFDAFRKDIIQFLQENSHQ